MRNRSTLNVSLTPTLERFVKRRVAKGHYQTASEVVREGLRLLERKEREEVAALNAVKAKLARGSAQADRDELVDPDALLKKIESLKRRRAANRS